MLSLSYFLLAICWSLTLDLVSAGTPIDYKVRNAPGASTADTYRAIRNALADAAVHKRDMDLKNSTSLDTTWDDAVLLKLLASLNHYRLVLPVGLA